MAALTGSLQIKKGRYYAVINMPGDDGKRHQRWISTGLEVNGNKKTAARRLREILNELEEQNHQFHSSIKFWELLEMWLDASEQRMRESTYRNCRWVFNAHIIPYFRQTGKNSRICAHITWKSTIIINWRPYPRIRSISIIPISTVHLNTPEKIGS